MDLKDLATVFSETLSRACNSGAISDAQTDLESLASEIAYQREMGTADPLKTQAVQVRVARRGLELQQHDVPRLNELAQQILQVAGPEAIRFVLAPVVRVGTDRLGNPMPPILSDFIDPEKFAGNRR